MKQLLIDFINYGIISCIFLIIPYSNKTFILLVIMLIMDLIHLYIVERREDYIFVDKGGKNEK